MTKSRPNSKQYLLSGECFEAIEEAYKTAKRQYPKVSYSKVVLERFNAYPDIRKRVREKYEELHHITKAENPGANLKFIKTLGEIHKRFLDKPEICEGINTIVEDALGNIAEYILEYNKKTEEEFMNKLKEEMEERYVKEP